MRMYSQRLLKRRRHMCGGISGRFRLKHDVKAEHTASEQLSATSATMIIRQSKSMATYARVFTAADQSTATHMRHKFGPVSGSSMMTRPSIVHLNNLLATCATITTNVHI